ncbi:transmembrane protein, putative (macronuclear) [Tetrahymena thermophila SB210]|uniref:Transmembrane protein, putative n=1 Tax=Tetrahymena thermophila (strain SB210) TaxID=312017 RepID=W7X368_TETTS|nr:transmembrane protein, putative [Tetrahymena thermophila SB210]EWS73745.1 transmembrane protein, putative [Tetrahymena thermophila SB210]|eukprot:XP_012653709.1 transmembrane protein, putative [Tetrahymena thermophila SB210]
MGFLAKIFQFRCLIHHVKSKFLDRFNLLLCIFLQKDDSIQFVFYLCILLTFFTLHQNCMISCLQEFHHQLVSFLIDLIGIIQVVLLLLKLFCLTLKSNVNYDQLQEVNNEFFLCNHQDMTFILGYWNSFLQECQQSIYL